MKFLLKLGWRIGRFFAPVAGNVSSFADPADVSAFRRCKRDGGTDKLCFKVGDNAIGCWDDDTSQGSGRSAAIPPDDMIAKWGSIANAKHKQIRVHANGRTISCVLKDRLPWKKFVKHNVAVDLNPDAVSALGLKPPILIPGSWEWN